MLALFVPAAGLMLYIYMFGVNVVYADEWDFVPFLKMAIEGTLSYGDLLAQHNEHRLFFPRIVMITLAKLTQYNTIAEMAFGWFMILATSLLIFRISWKGISSDGLSEFALIFLPASLLLFTYRQFEAILFGFPSVPFYLMIFGVVSSFCLLEYRRRRNIGFALSTLAAFVASFSSLQGLLVWPTGLVQILVSDSKRRSLVWGCAGVLVIATYLHGWVKPGQTPSLDYVLSDPILASSFFLALLGAAFSFELYTALPFGALVFLIAVVVFWRNHHGRFLRRNRVWLSLILFSTLSCLAVTAGRSGFGPIEGLSSRYTPVTIMGIIGLYFLSVDASRGFRAKRKKLAARVLLIIILVGWIISCGGGWVAGQIIKCRFETSAYVLKTYQSQPDENIRSWLYPVNTPSIRERAAFLEENRLNVFSQSATNVPTTNSTDCQTLFSLYESYKELASGKLSIAIFTAELARSPGISLIMVVSAIAVAVAVLIVYGAGALRDLS